MTDAKICIFCDCNTLVVQFTACTICGLDFCPDCRFSCDICQQQLCIVNVCKNCNHECDSKTLLTNKLQKLNKIIAEIENHLETEIEIAKVYQSVLNKLAKSQNLAKKADKILVDAGRKYQKSLVIDQDLRNEANKYRQMFNTLLTPTSTI